MKNTCTASVESKWFCFYKATNGIKRHLSVDTFGFPFFRLCMPADVSDDAGLVEILRANLDYFRTKPVKISKITLLLDDGYNPNKLTSELKTVYPKIITKIRFERASKPSKEERAAAGKTELVPIAPRWMIERSNAWMERCKSLTKNFESTLAHAKAQMEFYFVRLMFKRLAATA